MICWAPNCFLSWDLFLSLFEIHPFAHLSKSVECFVVVVVDEDEENWMKSWARVELRAVSIACFWARPSCWSWDVMVSKDWWFGFWFSVFWFILWFWWRQSGKRDGGSLIALLDHSSLRSSTFISTVPQYILYIPRSIRVSSPPITSPDPTHHHPFPFKLPRLYAFNRISTYSM